MSLGEVLADYAAQKTRHDAVQAALRECGMTPGLADATAAGRYWFSAWDGYHAPWCRRQRFQA